jgi:hypothetical protein
MRKRLLVTCCCENTSVSVPVKQGVSLVSPSYISPSSSIFGEVVAQFKDSILNGLADTLH